MLCSEQSAKPHEIIPNDPNKMKHAHTKPARRAPPKAARAGAIVFSALARMTKYADPTLAENWPTIAGPKISALCRPGRILGVKGKNPDAGRTLEVYPPSGAAAGELQMQLDDLIVRVNRFLGPGAIARISLIQATGSRAGPSARQNIARIPDNPASSSASAPLVKALASFQAAIARKSAPEKGKK